MIYSYFFNQLEELEYILFIKLIQRIDPVLKYNLETLKYIRPEIFLKEAKKFESKILQEHKIHYNNLVLKLENYIKER
jgi:hypothetical protein